MLKACREEVSDVTVKETDVYLCESPLRVAHIGRIEVGPADRQEGAVGGSSRSSDQGCLGTAWGSVQQHPPADDSGPGG